MEKLIHFLIPRESNNHRARVLHPSGILIIALFFIIFQSIISLLPLTGSKILGYTSSISPDEIVRLTNEKRAEAGLSKLILNKTLSEAASIKGRDMINKDYWAHVAPDGTEPWFFLNKVGYKYKYAGENLARDFSDASSVVEAWMESSTHKDNILNPKYKEIGIGVVEGDLAGIDTTIIVQFFGATYTDVLQNPIASIGVTTPSPVPTEMPVLITSISSPTGSVKSMISPFTSTQKVSSIIIGTLLIVFILDAVLVSRKKIMRISGRTFSHVAFLAMILGIIVILKSGKII